jgi:hypothetical protein
MAENNKEDAQKDEAEKYFNCSDRERLAFEAGIKLGSLFHQFIGTPLSLDNVEILENAISQCVKVQPFVDNVEVKIDRSNLRSKEGQSQYEYTTLSGPMLYVKLILKYNNIKIQTELKFKEDLNYPLMFINGFEQ